MKKALFGITGTAVLLIGIGIVMTGCGSAGKDTSMTDDNKASGVSANKPAPGPPANGEPAKGEVQVEGEVQGDIHAQRIVIGERARITGALIAEEVVVRGSVQGSIRGNAVTFQSSSRVEGDVFHKSLAIEQGAFFEGKSRRSDDPMSVQRTANGVPPPG